MASDIDVNILRKLFLEELETKPVSYIISKWMFECTPFVFNTIEDWLLWKEKLSTLLKVDSRAITITGSACVGFSLNPEKNFRDFTDQSDIDVAIISSHYFDISWHYLRNIGPERFKLNQIQKNSLHDHVNRLIYWGTIATDKILEILPFGKPWIESLAEMADVEPTVGRDINLRIYKDFDSLRAYHSNNLNNIKNNVLLRKIGGVSDEIILKHDA